MDDRQRKTLVNALGRAIHNRFTEVGLEALERFLNDPSAKYDEIMDNLLEYRRMALGETKEKT